MEQEFTGPAAFWPTTTPNLQTLYIIDRRIRLRTGASIPQGTPKFKGTGCTYVEVKPGDDKVWVSPRPGDRWGTSAFTFAATLWEAMRERGLKMVTYWWRPVAKTSGGCVSGKRSIVYADIP